MIFKLDKKINNPVVVHLLPFHGIGGVEIAADSMEDADLPQFRFQKIFLEDLTYAKNKSSSQIPNRQHRSIDSPRVYWRALLQLHFLAPKLLIASLWRSYAVTIMFKLSHPSVCTVIFLHSAGYSHIIDKWLSQLGMWLSTEIWVDSKATLVAKVPQSLRSRTRLISFLLTHQVSSVKPIPSPRFIFWGRLHADKDLSRALRLFERIHVAQGNAEFLVIGPDGGQRSALEEQVASLGLMHAVTFAGCMSRAEIFTTARDFSFYLQTSIVEGMAISVMEAMQLGLVPIVTPVGEIADYCRNMENAVIVKDVEEVVQSVQSLLERPSEYRRIARSAVSRWRTKNLYSEDVIAACAELVGRKK